MPYNKKYGKKKVFKNYKKGKSTSPKYKRMFRSTQQHTKVSADTLAKELYVKMPFSDTTQFSINQNSSIMYYWVGNSLAPDADLGSGQVSSGVLWASGVKEYCTMYNFYRVLASKITIQVVTLGSLNVLRCVLIPVSIGGTNTGGDSQLITKINEIQALTYDQSCLQPYAQCRVLGTTAGNNAVTYFKMFRKTKDMLSIKDIRDDNDNMFRMPDYTGLGGTIPFNANNAYAYVLKIFNTSGTNTQSVDVQCRMKLYTQLTGRNGIVPLVSTGPWS